jgi:putative oxidoreductase
MRYAQTLDRYAPYALAVLRIVTALILIEHGTQKLFGWPAPPQSGLPPAFSLYWIGGILESVGGLLILLGLLTRPVSFILAGEMAVAYWMSHAPRSFFPLSNGGDAAILYCFVFLLLVFTGPGAWSLDRRRERSGPRHSWEVCTSPAPSELMQVAPKVQNQEMPRMQSHTGRCACASRSRAAVSAKMLSVNRCSGLADGAGGMDRAAR